MQPPDEFVSSAATRGGHACLGTLLGTVGRFFAASVQNMEGNEPRRRFFRPLPCQTGRNRASFGDESPRTWAHSPETSTELGRADRERVVPRCGFAAALRRKRRYGRSRERQGTVASTAVSDPEPLERRSPSKANPTVLSMTEIAPSLPAKIPEMSF